MTPILIFTIIILAAAVLALIVFAQREAKKHEKKPLDDVLRPYKGPRNFVPIDQKISGEATLQYLIDSEQIEEFAGICKSAVETASQKEMRKERALALLRERGELSNAEIRTELGVSSRTVVKYMDELEREGKVEQVGKIGHAVTYRLK